jgi:hypothetical protein
MLEEGRYLLEHWYWDSSEILVILTRIVWKKNQYLCQVYLKFQQYLHRMSGKKYRSLYHKLNINRPWLEQKRHQDIYWYKTKYSAATKYNSVAILGSNRQLKKKISLLISDTHSLDFGVFIFAYLNLHFTMMIHAIYKGIYITGTSKKCFLSLVYIKFGSPGFWTMESDHSFCNK